MENTETEVAVLREKISHIERLFDKLDDAIGKIAEVNNSVSKMLAIHDERLTTQDKTDEVLFNKIDSLRQQMVQDHSSVLQRLSNLERKVWTGIGSMGVIVAIAQLVGPHITERVFSSTNSSDIIEEVRPSSLELHRQQVHQFSIGPTK